MDSFKAFSKNKNTDKYLYYMFDLRVEVGLSSLKSRVIHGYFYSKKTNNELLKYKASVMPNWGNSLLICSKDKVLKENPTIITLPQSNSDIYANLDGLNILPVVIPKKSLLMVMIPDAQYNRIVDGIKTFSFFDSTFATAEDIKVSLSNIKKYSLEKIYEVKFAPNSYYERSTLSLIQHSIPLSSVLSFVVDGDKDKKHETV